MTTSSTKFKIYVTDSFIDQAKRLAKKYPQIKDDFKELQKILKRDPITGNDSLGRDCYKVRMSITGKSKGQSGGARVIIEVKILNRKVYVLSVYDKADVSTILEKEMDKKIKERILKFPDLA